MPIRIDTFPPFPLPENTGDCYALLGYHAKDMAVLAFAQSESDPQREGRWVWVLVADDGDIYYCRSVEDFYAECPCHQVVLVRRAFEGLAPYIRDRVPPEQWPHFYHSWVRQLLYPEES